MLNAVKKRFNYHYYSYSLIKNKIKKKHLQKKNLFLNE